MSIPVTCRRCGATYDVPESHAGRMGRCSCGNPIPVPGLADARPPAPGPAPLGMAPLGGPAPGPAPMGGMGTAPLGGPAPASTPLGGPAPPQPAAASFEAPSPWSPPTQAPRPRTGPPGDLAPPRQGELPNPDAKTAIILALISLFCCGIFTAPFAIWKANLARRAIQSNPRLGGQATANVAYWIGWIAVVLSIIGIIQLALFLSRGGQLIPTGGGLPMGPMGQ